MKSVASAPGKVILFGEHFVVYGIKAILCAIDKRITATSRLLDEDTVRIITQLGKTEISVKELDHYDKVSARVMKPFYHIVKTVFEKFGQNKGIEIVIESEIPPGIGLGSSSAACVAVAASVCNLFGKTPEKEVLKIAIDAERTIFSEVSGADSAASTFGGIISYDKHGYEKINCSSDFNLIIANSKQAHNTNEVVTNVRKFKTGNESLFSNLCKQEEEIIKDALSALKENNLNKLGTLMTKNQELLDKIKVSTNKLDELIREARKTCYGTKITGAGGGGCTISLVDELNSSATMENLKKLSECFVAKIDYEGLKYL